MLRNALLILAVLAMAACAGRDESPADNADQAFDDVAAMIKSVVADPERASRATALIAELRQDLRDVAANVQERRASFVEMSSNYDVSRAELETLLSDVRATARSHEEAVSGVHRELRDILTAEEWDALEDGQSDALAAALAALRKM